MNTCTFTLPSGVECEVAELSGKQQRILTQQKGKKHWDNLNEMLSTILIRVGNITTDLDIDFVKAMLSEDRRYALWKAREFSLYDEDTLPEEKQFTFTWQYNDAQGERISIEKEVDVSEGINMRPYLTQVSNYSELNKDVEITLPRSKEVLKFTLLDGLGEERGAMIKKDDRSSHSPLLMRNPRLKYKETWIQADLDKMGLVDIEYLRTQIKKHEAKVDTEFMFEHPEADTRSDKNVIVDLLNLIAFSFPSQAI